MHGGGVVVTRCSHRAVVQRRGEAGGGASHRWQRPLYDQLGFRTIGGVLGGSSEPRARRPGPHLLFMALCDGAHQPC